MTLVRARRARLVEVHEVVFAWRCSLGKRLNIMFFRVASLCTAYLYWAWVLCSCNRFTFIQSHYMNQLKELWHRKSPEVNKDKASRVDLKLFGPRFSELKHRLCCSIIRILLLVHQFTFFTALQCNGMHQTVSLRKWPFHFLDLSQIFRHIELFLEWTKLIINKLLTYLTLYFPRKFRLTDSQKPRPRNPKTWALLATNHENIQDIGRLYLPSSILETTSLFCSLLFRSLHMAWNNIQLMHIFKC